jgi:hypothetical protein
VLVPEEDEPWVEEGPYLVRAEPGPGAPVRVRFRTRSRDVVLHHRTRNIEATLEGSAVKSMRSFGAPLTYFPEQP